MLESWIQLALHRLPQISVVGGFDALAIASNVITIPPELKSPQERVGNGAAKLVASPSANTGQNKGTL